MEIISDYESRVDSLVKKWNAGIEKLSSESRHASEEGKQKIDDEIALLIGKRESVRRGLFRVTEEEDLCLTCPDREEPADR